MYKKRKKYNRDMKARGAGFESANSLAQTNRWHNTASSSGGATVSTAASSYNARTSRNPLDKTEWVEYSDSLDDSLIEAK